MVTSIPEDGVNDFTFRRRYDSNTYRIAMVLCVILAVLFAIGAVRRPVSGAFAVLFVLGACGIYVGIRRQVKSGLTVSRTRLEWFCTLGVDPPGSVELSSIRQVDWKSFDAESITMTLEDQSCFTLDHRYFGDGAVVLAALQERLPDVVLQKDGRPWCA